MTTYIRNIVRGYVTSGTSVTTPVYSNGTAGTTWLSTTGSTPTGGWLNQCVGLSIDDDDPQWSGRSYDNNSITVRDGQERNIKLPDGTVIAVTKDGSFTINDKDAKVIYRANRVRDFNSFLNASDKLESFIKFCGSLGVRQDEMLNIPVKHFIAWLIIEAARADGEQPDVKLLDGIHSHVKPQHCISCGRFISRKLTVRKIAVCRPVCLERQLRIAA